MDLNFSKFKKFIEEYAKPRWEKFHEKWPLRPGGGELYLQEKILGKTDKILSKEAIRGNVSTTLIQTMNAHVNLLSQFEFSFAKTFITETEEEILSEKTLSLLYGKESLEKRLFEFLEWAKVKPVPNTKKKKGINATVCSYFLGLSNPKKYAYCKPIAYKAAVDTLLTKQDRITDPVKRIIHCKDLYVEVLNFLETEYGLENGNLLDVHSLFYILNETTKPKLQYWVYAPGHGAELWDELYDQGIIAIGWDKIGDLREYDSKESIKKKLKETYGYDANPTNRALACYEFVNEVKEGDIVFAKKGTKELLGYGVVISDYIYDESRKKYKNVRKVDWKIRGSWDFSDDGFALKTLTNITPNSDYVEKLQGIVKSKPRIKNYWWVCQGKTYEKEKAGGFIWAPKANEKGQTFSHWQSMTKVEPGDIVINYASKKIVAMSVAKAKAYEHDNELSEGIWERRGWKIDLEYFELKKSILLEEIQPLMPSINKSIKQNRPFNSVNGINQGYLFDFSIVGLRQIADKLRDRIPSEILQLIPGEPQMDFTSFLKDEGFYFSPDQIKRFILSLKTKPFVILTGNSGTGKTKLAQLYAQYIGELTSNDGPQKQVDELMTRRWFKLSYKDKDVVQSFQGAGRKIDQIRNTILDEGLMSLGWLDTDDDREPKQKDMMKNLQDGDVIIAYQGGYTIGGIGVVEKSHFVDDNGDAFEAFNETTKNFIRVDWIFRGPLKIKDFQFQEYKVAAFGMWVDTIHQLDQSHVERFVEYLLTKDIQLTKDTAKTTTKRYALIPVGANWTDKRQLLGFHNVITEKYQKTKALDLILETQKSQEQGWDNPFFLILDEMNLSHVERYFSDFLSALESEEKIPLHNSDEVEQEQDISKDLALPKNLYVIGTVNVDETTYMFSPKVLDRANVIEFHTTPALKYLEGNLQSESGNEPSFPGDVIIRSMPPSEIFQKMEGVQIEDARTPQLHLKISYEIETFQKALKQIGFDFGFRVMNEIVRYMYMSWEADGKPVKWDGWANAYDTQILQKMLPKIHGSAKIIQNMLKCLYCYCFAGKTNEQLAKLTNGEFVPELYEKNYNEARYKKSAQKLKMMQKYLENQRYVSFT